MSKLSKLTHPDDNPQIIREACFYAGWQLRSPNSWAYMDLFTGELGVVTIEGLVKAVENKRERLKNNERTNYLSPSQRRI